MPANPTPFEEVWLAETLALSGLARAQGGRDAEAAIAHAQAVPGDARQRLRAWMLRRAQDTGLADALARMQALRRVLLPGVVLLCAITGFGGALAVLGDGSRAVNVVWALGGLLGVHGFSLLLWVAGFWLPAPPSGGLRGRGWQWLMACVAGHDAAELAGAQLALHARHGLTRWALGALVHLAWAALLLGVLAGLLMSFSVRRYGFVWETTVLPGAVMERLVDVLGALPALLGFAVPDASVIGRSGLGMVADEAGRQAWAGWMLGCVLVYGVLPRVLLWLFCVLRLRLGRQRLRLDPLRAEFAGIVARIAPPSERLGVRDAAPAELDFPRRAAAHAHGRGAPLLLGVELAEQRLPRLPAASPARAWGVIDGREARRQALAELEALAPVRLLVVCSAALSPDRGSLGLVAELSRLAGEVRVLLDAAGEHAERAAHWRTGLCEAGFEAGQIFAGADAALGWLEHGDV
ncbi:DUF2868 domain-containing protein [Pseudothauera nasutitermitis]|uniref:DUF2868 domain-containing protein n=1 Tax=Pseudothauera nasutitermitis TaxID=2565930 RepID=A0A4S4B4I8_9RHOO|nr:DUF2868 domain-containing protein [Pseudothauera nasutitermitis]THF65844.1 DUF2868 domain-containing protein [Pseudothauera nasutitermitis]